MAHGGNHDNTACYHDNTTCYHDNTTCSNTHLHGECHGRRVSDPDSEPKQDAVSYYQGVEGTNSEVGGRCCGPGDGVIILR